MSLNFFTRFFSGNKATSGGDKEGVVEPQLVPIRRLSTSKSGKLRMKKVKSSQSIKDISFHHKRENENEDVKKEANDAEEGDVSVEEVIKEMHEVVHQCGVK